MFVKKKTGNGRKVLLEKAPLDKEFVNSSKFRQDMH